VIMTSKDEKIAQLLAKVEDLCLSDENFFATGWESDGRHKWVAWIILKPGCQPTVFDSGLPNGGCFEIDQLAESRIDRLLQLTWRCPKPVGALDKFTRAAGSDLNSGLGHKSGRELTISDIDGETMTDIARLIIKHLYTQRDRDRLESTTSTSHLASITCQPQTPLAPTPEMTKS